MSVTVCDALEQFCVCGHAWWAHHRELEVACIARGCDCPLAPPECQCPEEPA